MEGENRSSDLGSFMAQGVRDQNEVETRPHAQAMLADTRPGSKDDTISAVDV